MTHRVFILGELNVDLILTGIDILPEWNKEKLADTFELAMGSSSAITACVLAGLGADVSFVGVVGDVFSHPCWRPPVDALPVIDGIREPRVDVTRARSPNAERGGRSRIPGRGVHTQAVARPRPTPGVRRRHPGAS